MMSQFLFCSLKLLKDIKDNGIRIYDFPECDEDEDEEFKRQDAELKVNTPCVLHQGGLLVSYPCLDSVSTTTITQTQLLQQQVNLLCSYCSLLFHLLWLAAMV